MAPRSWSGGVVVTTAGRQGLVSVVIPTFNRARTLERAIRSVLIQTYSDLELIVVDDGSTDGTAALMAGIVDPRVIYHPLAQNQGASAARNAGMKLARGEFIAFQDSDDEWLADKLKVQVAAARGAHSTDVVVFHMKVVYGRDEHRVYGPGRVCCVPDLPATDVPRDFLQISYQRNLISPQTLMFSRSLLDRVGFFDPLLVNSEDWDYSIRLTREGEVIYIPEPLVMTYIQDDSISILKRSSARSQLKILLKLRRLSDVDPKVLSAHFARIGMAIGRLGKPRQADKLMRQAVALAPGSLGNWARLAFNMSKGRI